MLILSSVFQKKSTNSCCYGLNSSNVNKSKERCCWWYCSQFKNVEKVWVQAEILCFDFPKTSESWYSQESSNLPKLWVFFYLIFFIRMELNSSKRKTYKSYVQSKQHMIHNKYNWCNPTLRKLIFIKLPNCGTIYYINRSKNNCVPTKNGSELELTAIKMTCQHALQNNNSPV